MTGLAGAAEHGVREVSPNHLKLSSGELSVGLNRDWRGPMPDVQRVLIIVHGRLRNAIRLPPRQARSATR